MLKLIEYNDARKFLSDNKSFLEKQEALNSLLLGLSNISMSKNDGETTFLSIKRNESLIFSGISTKSRNLILYASSQFSDEAIEILIRFLYKNLNKIPGINGPKQTVDSIIQQWKTNGLTNLKKGFDHKVYELTKVIEPQVINGQFLTAKIDHLDIISDWFKQFMEEALGQNILMDDAKKMAEEKLKNKEIFLWNHNEIVSMACTARPTENGITVNYVFTPKEHRKKGYASMLVADLCKEMLSKYAFVTLFADSYNASTNKIYQAIGFKEIGDFSEIYFQKNS